MRVKKILFFILLTVVTILLSEIFIRWSGIYQTYSEKNFNRFESYYGKTMPNWYHLHPPNTEIIIPQTEFSYPVKSNALGLINPEISFDKNKQTKRILFLGDSFTQGVGAAADSAMPRLFENLLQQKGLSNIEIINAGIVGSDVFFEHVLLRHQLKNIKPDHIILILNYSDLSDYIVRGGTSRFLKDGTVTFKAAPKVEKYYRYSHVLRALLHFVLKYDFTLINPLHAEQHYQEAATAVAQEVIAMKKWCAQHQISFLCVLHPYPFGWKKNVPGYAYMNMVKDILQENQILLLDTYPDFEPYLNTSNYLHYAWEKDGHFNGAGYLLFAQILNSKINSHFPHILEVPMNE